MPLMNMMGRPAFDKVGDRLVRVYNNEILWVEPWGENSLRVRGTRSGRIDETTAWALLEPGTSKCKVVVRDDGAEIVNGKISATIDEFGWLTFRNQRGEVLLEEFWQVKEGREETSTIELPARQYRPYMGSDDYTITQRFKPHDDERIYGLGQRQIAQLDMKGTVLELAHRNSQASIPFALSNKGYGFLWNNPAIGRVSFATNLTEWVAERTEQLDYWITAGDTPAEVEESYSAATGRVPMMPEYGLGFWQCKLRYKTQDELLEVAREYKRRKLPLSVIVVDFFHWPLQGDFRFDPNYWPDPDAMVAELKEMGVELMVSIWPTVDVNSENHDEMYARGLLVRTDRGTPTNINFMGNVMFYDATNEEARRFVWEKVRSNYFDKGIKTFWLDEAEPDLMGHYDYDLMRYHAGPAMKVGNLYPLHYAQGFYEGQTAAGQENVVNLIRCAWAGSQRYGTLLWSGDVHSTFESLRRQFAAGLNAGISGIPWWTSDIGGFMGGDIGDPEFHELLIRWFQFGVFCPVTRLHGWREPIGPAQMEAWRTFTGPLDSGAENEVWSFGEEVYEILKGYLHLRERLRPYVREQMRAAHEKGTPVIRPLFFDFPEDATAWQVEDQYMFGPDILVAPVLERGVRERTVYLPAGRTWVDTATGEEHPGGRTVKLPADLATIPVLVREGAQVLHVLRGALAEAARA